MKPVIAPYARPLYCMRIECVNGTIVRMVEYPYDVTIGGSVYRADTGYSFTGMNSGVALSPGVIDLTSFVGLSPEVTIANIQSGIFDGARVYIFATDWADPQLDEEPIMKGLFGKTTIVDKQYTTECMQLIDLLNTTVDEEFSALCTLEFGGQEFGGCKVDVDALEVTGAITSVTDSYTFADSALGETNDYFGAGVLTFTSGENAGIAGQRVKSYTAAGGVLVMSEAFPYPPQVGDTFTLRPGCRKRREEDCRDKWDNVERRRGFDDVPGQRFMNKVGVGQ
jgi:uncharacterized phage protein (TIGR02218 family)